MMKINKLSLAAAVSVALLSSTAMADSWTITQSVAPGANTTINQSETTGSTQSMNTINSSTAEILGTSKQTVTAATGTTLTLDQKDGTGTSTQAMNYANGNNLGVVGSAFIQEQIGDGNVTLSQSASGANTQAINAAVATAAALNLGQTIDTASVVTLNQVEGVGTGSVQAGNIMNASATTAASTIDQSLDAPTLDMNQGSASGTTFTSNLQAGNAVITATASSGGTVTQGATQSAALTMDQISTISSHQAVNYVGVTLP